MRGQRRFCRVTFCLIVLALAPQWATAKDGKTKYQFGIASGGLERVLEDVREQTGFDVLYSYDLIDVDGVNAVSGTYTIGEALELMLQDTDLSGSLTESGMIVITRNEGRAEMRSQKVQMKQKTLKRSLLASVAAFLMGGTGANAQDEKAESADTVVVTGSRIARTGFDTATPTVVISSEEITNTGLEDLGIILMQKPQIGIGLASGNDNFNRDIGSSFINLRGLGTNRTLVLVDGRRRVSGSREGSQVDLSSIPPGMIENIEIITGGASAVYGADAVSGVVNIKLKEDFEGLEVTARGGISQRGDAETYSVYLNGGGSFADGNGHASFGASIQGVERLANVERDFAFGPGRIAFIFNPADTGPNDGIADLIPASDPKAIGIPYQLGFYDSAARQRYIYDGGIIAIPQEECFGASNNICTTPYGYDRRERTLRTPRNVFSAMSNVSYEITPDVRFKAGFDFAYSETDTNGQSFFDARIPIARDNPFLPADLATYMDDNGLTTLSVGTLHDERLGNRQYNNSRYNYTASVGFEGTLADRFDWELFYQYGRRTQNYSIGNTRIEERWLHTLDPVVVDGQIVCADEDARAAGCVPINLFNGQPVSDADKAYFLYSFQRNVENTQSLAGFQVTGPLVALPAGPLSVALGGEYRRDKLDARDDGLAARGELYRTDNGAQPASAAIDVLEGFVEVVAPVLSDQMLAESLEVEGAVRFSDYSSIGSTLAWKLGASWAPIEDIRFRVTRSKSVRAPNIIEAFGPQSNASASVGTDPCDVTRINDSATREANCRALGIPVGWIDPVAGFSRTSFRGGNPDLTEEVSNSLTVGAIVTPSIVPGLRLSADFWTIDIEDAVQLPSARKIVDNCVDSASLDNAFCPLITRGGFVGFDDPYVISRTDLRQINIGALTAKGIDVSAAYGFDMASLSSQFSGDMNLSLDVVHLMELEELVDPLDPSSLQIEDGESDDPSWRANASATYTLDELNVTWNTRYVGSSVIDRQRIERFGDLRNDARFYHDLVMSYELPSQLNIQFGINNLFDTKPPSVPGASLGIFNGQLYDNIGRNFFLSVNKAF